LKELQYDPDRLRAPLRHTASGGYEEIGWEEAWAYAAERLDALREVQRFIWPSIACRLTGLSDPLRR
jgi:anaerobic selenocysteine-containing dehydrogenase